MEGLKLLGILYGVTGKRKVRWIVGGILGVVAPYVVISFWYSWGSEDARFERALNRIIAEHGFEYKPDSSGSSAIGFGEYLDFEVYTGAPIDQEDQEQIVAQLNEACPSCSFAVETMVEGAEYAVSHSAGTTYESYFFNAPAGSRIDFIAIVFDDKGLSSSGAPPHSFMRVGRGSESGPSAFMRHLWPW